MCVNKINFNYHFDGWMNDNDMEYVSSIWEVLYEWSVDTRPSPHPALHAELIWLAILPFYIQNFPDFTHPHLIPLPF